MVCKDFIEVFVMSRFEYCRYFLFVRDLFGNFLFFEFDDFMVGFFFL